MRNAWMLISRCLSTCSTIQTFLIQLITLLKPAASHLSCLTCTIRTTEIVQLVRWNQPFDLVLYHTFVELLPPQSVSLFTSVVKMSVWPFNETSFANYFSVLSNLGNENRVACLLAVVLVSEVDKEIILITDLPYKVQALLQIIGHLH